MEPQTELVDDILYELAFDAEPDSLKQLCQANRFLQTVCNKPGFWRKKYLHDFGEVPDIDWRLLSKFHSTYGTLKIGIQSDELQFYVFPDLRLRKCCVISPDKIAVIDFKHNLTIIGLTRFQDTVVFDMTFKMADVYDVSEHYIIGWDRKLYNLDTLEQYNIKFVPEKLNIDVIIDTNNYLWSLGRADFIKYPHQVLDVNGHYIIDLNHKVYFWSLHFDDTYETQLVENVSAFYYEDHFYVNMDNQLILLEQGAVPVNTNIDVRSTNTRKLGSGPVMVVDSNYRLMYYNGDEEKFEVRDEFVTSFSYDYMVTAYISMN